MDLRRILLLALISLVVPPTFTARPSGPASVVPAPCEATDATTVAARIDTTVGNIFDAFNRRDRAAYVDAFTLDMVMLPPGNPIIRGRIGAEESYFQTPPGLRYEGIRWSDRRFHRIGSLIVETGFADFQFRLAPEGPVMSDHRDALTIWVDDGSGALRVKVIAWNALPQTHGIRGDTTPRAFACADDAGPMSASGDFSAVLEAETAFHRAFEDQRLSEAAAFYAEHATLSAPSTPTLRGLAAIRAHITSVPPEHRARTVERQVAHVEGNEKHAIVVNLFRWIFIVPDTDVPLSFSGKGVHLWERAPDGSWRIVFDLVNPSRPAG
jgi:ketosteroid isomerase-like protein